VSSISNCSKAAVRIAIAACLFTIGAGVATAIERMPLPAFALTTANGTTITSESLIRPDGWALIYVSPQCVPCRAILHSFDRSSYPMLARRLVIVVAGVTPDGLRAEAALYPDLSEATWLGDAANAVPQPIVQGGVPAIIGLRGRMIEWGLAGVLTDPADAKSILVTWVSAQR
jgi:hypothetical protein